MAQFQAEGIKTAIPVNILIYDRHEYLSGDLYTGFSEGLYSEATSEDGFIRSLWPIM